MTHRPIVWAIARKVAAVLSLCAATVLPYGADTRFGLIENGRDYFAAGLHDSSSVTRSRV